MSMSIKKRLVIGAGAITTVAAAATLVAGVTFGLFSANQGSSSSTFNTGTVSIGSPANTVCTVSNMVPGDSSTGWAGNPVAGQTDTQTAACTFSVTYTGSAPAWIGLQLNDSSTSTTNLYSGVSGTGLQFQVSDGTHSYTTSGIFNDTGGSISDPLFVAADTGNGGGGDLTYTFTVNYALPSSAGNLYQGTNTSLSMTVYAVQSGNNGTAGTAGVNTGNNTIAWS